jgi:hypothetical protein
MAAICMAKPGVMIDPLPVRILVFSGGAAHSQFAAEYRRPGHTGESAAGFVDLLYFSRAPIYCG